MREWRPGVKCVSTGRTASARDGGACRMHLQDVLAGCACRMGGWQPYVKHGLKYGSASQMDCRGW